MSPEGAALASRGASAVGYDAIVIGGNIAGLTVAHLLSQWGYRTCLVERAPRVGGVDASFESATGRTWDFGLHGLDFMRSEFTTRMFVDVLGGEVNRIERKRAIVLRNQLVAYDAPLDQWPDELRELFPAGDLVDELGSGVPSRENLAVYYGREFADLIFDEALPSYPSEARHLAFGVGEEQLMANIYPWFFPRAKRVRAGTSDSRRYQDLVREEPREYQLYPRNGGFGAFPEALRSRLEERGVCLEIGATDLSFDIDEETRQVKSIHANGRRYVAPRVYWCAPPGALCETLGLPVPATSPDTFILGSIQFEQPIDSEYTEILLADSEHLVNRISFPGKFALERDDLVQLEFAFPTAGEAYDTKPAYWLERFTTSLRQLGLVAPGNAVVDFDLKTVPILYNAFGVEGEPMPEFDFSDVIPASSNLKPVLPTIRKVNINSRVPMYLRFLTEDLLSFAAAPAAGAWGVGSEGP